MKLPIIHHEQSKLTAQELASYERKLRDELERMRAAAKEVYGDERASINLPLDLEHLRLSRQMAAKYKDVSLIIVVGIGGSNLGTMAVQEAVLGRLHNVAPGKRPRILYADTVDPDTMARINAIMDDELRRGKKVVLNCISKSGATTETVANFEVLLQTLAKRRKDYKKYVVMTSEEDSHLWNVAKEEGFAVLPMPKRVGGRYSVLSPVGLFPLAIVGVDIKELLDGAAHMRAACLKDRENPAMLRAAILANAHQQGRVIADNFYFKTDLESVGKWYRQLMGESIGKEWNRDGTRQVHMGMTPTVSVGSTDLHSMAQLYFGGPNDKLFTLVTVAKHDAEPKMPSIHTYDQLVPNIQGKKLSTIMDAIAGGVAITLEKENRPFCRIELPDASEHTIGALLQLHMMEMMYLAALLDVNPFDQPNVESYKIETKRILARRKGA